MHRNSEKSRCRRSQASEITNTASSLTGRKSGYQNTGVARKEAKRRPVHSGLRGINDRMLEIPETPPAVEKTACSPQLSVVRVVGKQSSVEGSQCLVLCWMQHQEEAADPALNRLFRRCDEKVTAQHERLSSRRPRKHSRARDPQDFDRPRKKPNKPQISTSPSHLVEVNLALDSDANSIDLGTI